MISAGRKVVGRCLMMEYAVVSVVTWRNVKCIRLERGVGADLETDMETYWWLDLSVLRTRPSRFKDVRFPPTIVPLNVSSFGSRWISKVAK